MYLGKSTKSTFLPHISSFSCLIARKKAFCISFFKFDSVTAFKLITFLIFTTWRPNTSPKISLDSTEKYNKTTDRYMNEKKYPFTWLLDWKTFHWYGLHPFHLQVSPVFGINGMVCFHPAAPYFTEDIVGNLIVWGAAPIKPTNQMKIGKCIPSTH